MPTVTIDDQQIEVEAGITVLQACEIAGAEIPRFCYHDRLSIAGNCRMCLVEISPGSPKPQASCAVPVNEGMVIKTQSDMVKNAREGVMEFLLINHPLDCPICDQGGECDLQDQAMGYGHKHSRFGEMKRAVSEKEMGPLVATAMTRCIHCTRCVRFSHEVAGVDDMGLVNRGEGAEITTLGAAISSELSGNVIDLCPVGALTSKPYAYTARPWELRKTETIDVMDAVGTNIRIDARGNQIMRIVPRLNEAINEEWLADKGRFCVDALCVQRLDRPYVRDAKGVLQKSTWPEALAAAGKLLTKTKPAEIAAVAGDMCDLESMYALKQIMQNLGVASLDCRQDGAAIDYSARGNYVFNTTIEGIEQADALLLIGCNPRTEAPIINARIRKRWLQGGISIASIGAGAKLTYDFEDFGPNIKQLDALLSGDHPFAKRLKSAKKPMVILGAGVLAHKAGKKILAATQAICQKYGMLIDGWNGFNVLHLAAARVGGLDIGFVPLKGGISAQNLGKNITDGKIKCVYLLGADEIDIPEGCSVIYQGHHGDRGAARADVILPGLAYTEKSGTYVNTEGRVQMAKRGVFGPGEAKEDWAILRALSENLPKILPFDDIGGLRKAMREAYPLLLEQDVANICEMKILDYKADSLPAGNFVPSIENYYMSDVISRNSATMAQCTREISLNDTKATGTDG